MNDRPARGRGRSECRVAQNIDMCFLHTYCVGDIVLVLVKAGSHKILMGHTRSQHVLSAHVLRGRRFGFCECRVTQNLDGSHKLSTRDFCARIVWATLFWF